MKLSRTNTVLAKMKEQGITHALVSDPYSIFYLTGFLENPGERFFAILLDEYSIPIRRRFRFRNRKLLRY